MTKRIIYILMTVSALLFAVNAQTMTSSTQDFNNRVQNNVLGISFMKVGEINQIDSTNYNITLQSSGTNSGYNAIAHISVSNRMFVDLPGSYGGRLYLGTPNSIQLTKNIVKVDSIVSGLQNYQREYWVVYAGMGMWDCVINCYEQHEGQYYIVSYNQDKLLGKPGEIIDGKQLNAEDLKSQALSFLQDGTNSSINEFYKLLASFQIQN